MIFSNITCILHRENETQRLKILDDSQKAMQLLNDQDRYEYHGLVLEPGLLTTMAGHLLEIGISQIKKIVLNN